MTKAKRLPAWYKLHLKNEISKLERALKYLDKADEMLEKHQLFLAKLYFISAEAIL